MAENEESKVGQKSPIHTFNLKETRLQARFVLDNSRRCGHHAVEWASLLCSSTQPMHAVPIQQQGALPAAATAPHGVARGSSGVG